MTKERCKNGCNLMPFSDGYCAYCHRMGFNHPSSEPQKTQPSPKPKQKAKIRPRSKKRMKEPSQVDTFKEIWSERKHISAVSGRRLEAEEGSSIWRCYFAHILNKKNWTKYRNLKDNVLLLHQEEHNAVDLGTEDQRRKYKEEWESKGFKVDWDVFYDKQKELKLKYKEL